MHSQWEEVGFRSQNLMMPTQLAASMQIALGLLRCWRRVFPTEDLRKSPIPYLFMRPECGFFLAKLWTINLAKRQRQTKQTKCNLIMSRNCLKIIFPMARKNIPFGPSLSTIESLIKYSWNFWRATSAAQTKWDGAVRRIKFALAKLEARNGEVETVSESQFEWQSLLLWLEGHQSSWVCQS